MANGMSMHQFTQRLVSESLNIAAPAMISRIAMGKVQDIGFTLLLPLPNRDTTGSKPAIDFR
jgi:hypothetical protein